MAEFTAPATLQAHRPLLLAMEAIGWLHMTGKANAQFLREHGGQKTGYKYETWLKKGASEFPWDDLLQWAVCFLETDKCRIDPGAWPGSAADFIEKHTKQNAGLLGLLQAGHGMASGIEKNVPKEASRYLGQDASHMWLSSAFGDPVRNLLADAPSILTPKGWTDLLLEIRRILEALRDLGSSGCNDPGLWGCWREGAIGAEGALRRAFSVTLAETRLPNNEVTLWDQSYVAACLFKSATAGAILEGSSFPWNDNGIKRKARWRLLTVGIGADHYEARAVRIGDWSGARLALDNFFGRVRKLIEVDLAVGSLLYADGSIHVFSFPGEAANAGNPDLSAGEWCRWLQEHTDTLAQNLDLETPPHCRIGPATRSLVPMTKEIDEARKVLAIPLHRPWPVETVREPQSPATGHVCPVCLVRPNLSTSDKEKPCGPCYGRRTHRLDAWLGGEFGLDTIWIDEIADRNDRAALITLSLDIEPWLDGTRLDALRAQAIPEWRRHNPTLSENVNPIDPVQPYSSLIDYVKSKLGGFDEKDSVLNSLQEGYRKEKQRNDERQGREIWANFFDKIVEDRADEAPSWAGLEGKDDLRARWLVHQLFRKLPSPGRVYRFWRQSEAFFAELLSEFREIAASDANRWRVRRLVLKPDNANENQDWRDRQTYEGRWRDAPVSVLYRKSTKDFITATNLARLLRSDEGAEQFKEQLKDKVDIPLRCDDDRVERMLRVEAVDEPGALGVYHPVISLDLSPVRFRVLVPLEAVSACIDHAIAAWNEQFARVWDRLPLRAGVVAFPRMVPFQAVIEAARNVEDDLDEPDAETWRVAEAQPRDGVVALNLRRSSRDSDSELRTVPVRLPDGRSDVFYPYLAVQDQKVRFPRDFQHPSWQVFRHALDLRRGDGVVVHPARIGTVFLDSTARRFETIDIRPLAEWQRMRESWSLAVDTAPSLTALRSAWTELVDRRESWQSLDGEWLDGGEDAWKKLVRAIFHGRLGARGSALDHLVEAAADGCLAWALDWHLSVLKERLPEVTHGG